MDITLIKTTTPNLRKWSSHTTINKGRGSHGLKYRIHGFNGTYAQTNGGIECQIQNACWNGDSNNRRFHRDPDFRRIFANFLRNEAGNTCGFGREQSSEISTITSLGLGLRWGLMVIEITHSPASLDRSEILKKKLKMNDIVKTHPLVDYKSLFSEPYQALLLMFEFQNQLQDGTVSVETTPLILLSEKQIRDLSRIFDSAVEKLDQTNLGNKNVS